MIIAFLITLVVIVAIPIGWVLLRMARWAAPVSAAVGLLIAWGAAYVGWLRALGFGAGLFLFSILLFVIAGGMRGR